MNTNQTLSIIAVLYFGSVVTALAQNQVEPNERVRAQAKGVSPNDNVFTCTIRSEQTSNGKTEQKVSVENFVCR